MQQAYQIMLCGNSLHDLHGQLVLGIIIPPLSEDKSSFVGMGRHPTRARCGAYRYCPLPLGIVTWQLFSYKKQASDKDVKTHSYFRLWASSFLF